MLIKYDTNVHFANDLISANDCKIKINIRGRGCERELLWEW